MIIETEAIFAPGDVSVLEGVTTASQGVDSSDKLEHHLSGMDIAVWTEIFTREGLFACHKDARIKLVGHHDPGERFVVFQQHVISRLILLYHGVLKIESILFGRHNYITNVGNGSNKEVRAHAVVGMAEIRGYPPLKILSLAHINNLTLGVIICIDSGCVGQNLYFCL